MQLGNKIYTNSPNHKQRSIRSLSQNIFDFNEKQSDIISQLSILQPEFQSKNSDIFHFQTHEKQKELLKIQNIQQILQAKSLNEKDQQDLQIETLLHENVDFLKLLKQRSDLPMIKEQNNSKQQISSDSNSKDESNSNKIQNKSVQSIKNHYKIALIKDYFNDPQTQENDLNESQKTKQLNKNFHRKIEILTENGESDNLSQQIEFTTPTPQKQDYFDGLIYETKSKTVSMSSQKQDNSQEKNDILDKQVDDFFIKQDENNNTEQQNNSDQNDNSSKKDRISKRKTLKIQFQISNDSNKEEVENPISLNKNNSRSPQQQLEPIGEVNIANNFVLSQSFKNDSDAAFSRISTTRRLTNQRRTGVFINAETSNFQNLLYSNTHKNFDKEDLYPWYIISPFTKYKSFWNILLLLVMFFNAVVVPFRLAFRHEIKVDFVIVDTLIDILFIIEFLQSFVTAFEDQEGKVIKSLKEIISHYLKGWFWIDFISSVMVLLMMTSENQNIMRLFRIPKIYKQIKQIKLLHILKSGPILKFMLFLKINSHYMDILRFSLIILFLIHIAGSLWYYIGSFTPKFNWTNQFFKTNNVPVSTKYIASVYYVLSVLTTVGYGNIASTTENEYIFTILFMFFAVVIYSWILGVLTYSFFKINEKSTILKNRFIYFNQIVQNYKLSKQIQEKLLKTVQMGFHSTSNRKLDIFQNNPIIKDLPDELASKVCEEIFQNIIKKIPFLNDKPGQFISNVIQSVKSYHMNPGDLLYKKGDAPKDVYFVVKGRILTKIQSSFLNFKTLVYVEGSFFGEVDLIFKRERKQNAFAETKCEIWRLTKTDFFRIMNYSEEIKSEILHLAIKREEMLMKEEMKLLRTKLKENPSLNSLIFDVPTPTKNKGALLKTCFFNSQQSISEMINDEIAIQSKKRAYNSNFAKEMSLTDIIKLSTKKLITSDDELKEVQQKDSLNQTQSSLKAYAIEKMLEKINSRDEISLNKQQINEMYQAKKLIPFIKRACSIDTKHYYNHAKKDQELEEVLKKTVNTIRNYLK